MKGRARATSIITAKELLQEYADTKEEAEAAHGDAPQEEEVAAAAAAAPQADAMSPKSAQQKKDEEALAKAAKSRCLVYCRLRPTKKNEYEEEGTYQLLTMHKKTVKVQDSNNYDFDGTFGGDSQQADIFDAVARPCLDHALDGYCAAIMCYGQTGTGKSFTMCNTRPGQEGIIPRAAQYIFDKAAKSETRTYEFEAQFIQIYRDNLGDLMQEGGKEKVDIHFEKETGVTLTGCSTNKLESPEQFMKMYEEGNTRRVTTATAMNPESSRGHSALVVTVTSTPKVDDCTLPQRGKITFIDLAGYERFSKTGIGNANPIMKDEAKTINASLLSLGHVVSALSNGDKHIPWRNSKLTRLLQDSIGGRSRTTIVLTVGPSSDHLHESTNTLQLGQRAMAVKVEAKATTNLNYEALAGKLQALLDEKEERINVLEVQAAARDAEREDLMSRHERDLESMKKKHAEDLKSLIESGASQETILAHIQQNQVEQDLMAEQQREELIYTAEAYDNETKELVNEHMHQEDVRWAEDKLRLEEEIRALRQQLRETVAGEDVAMAKEAEATIASLNNLLAERANQIGALEGSCSRLRDQVDSLGAVPVVTAEEATESQTLFIDISQVMELKARHAKELAEVQARAAEQKVQLDKALERCAERAQDIASLGEHNKALQDQLESNGLAVPAMAVRTERVVMVDQQQVEAVRQLLQAEVNQRAAEADELREQLKVAQATAAAANMAAAIAQQDGGRPPLTTRPRSGTTNSSATPPNVSFSGTRSRSGTLMAAAGGGVTPRATGGVTPRTTGGGVTPRATGGDAALDASSARAAAAAAEIEARGLELERLQSTLADAHQQNEGLQAEVRMLNKKLEDAGLEVKKNAAESARASVDTTEYRRLLELKDADIAELSAMLMQREDALQSKSRQFHAMEAHASSLRALLKKNDIDLDQKTMDAPPKAVEDESAAVDQLFSLVASLRERNTVLEGDLIAAKAKVRDLTAQLIDHGVDVEPSPENAASADQVAELSERLAEKDKELVAMDRRVVAAAEAKAAMNQTVVLLHRQVMLTGLTPCCDLSADAKDAAKVLEERDEELAQQRKEYEQRLKAQEDQRNAVADALASLRSDNTNRLKRLEEVEEEKERLKRTSELAHAQLEKTKALAAELESKAQERGEALAQQRKEFEEKLKTQETQREAVAEALASLQKESSDRQEQLAKAEEEKAMLQQKSEEAQTQLEATKAVAAKQAADADKSSADQVLDLQDRVARLEQEIQEQTSVMMELQAINALMTDKERKGFLARLKKK